MFLCESKSHLLSLCDTLHLKVNSVHSLIFTLVLAVLGLCCRAQALRARPLSSCGSQAQLPQGTWDRPRPGVKPTSPVWAGRFFITGPPGRSNAMRLIHLTYIRCVYVYADGIL